MKKPSLWLLALVLAQCHNKHDTTPEDQLPPATQTGANTFGCLLNGQPFLPNGNDGNIGGANYRVVYDPTFNGGEITIAAFRYTTKGDPDTRQDIALYLSSFQAPGRYSLNLPRQQDAAFIDTQRRCSFIFGDPYFRRGTLTITRLDKQAGIVSGTFSFKLYKPGCDSVIVTQGRFDKKL